MTTEESQEKQQKQENQQPLARRKTVREIAEDIPWYEELPGVFRGVAAATQKFVLTAKAAAAKVAAAKQVSIKTAVRSIGENRPLAFASEGAVAGESMLPRVIYYGAWTLSGLAIGADIYTKHEDAPADKKWQTALYWTTFHIPASLVVPAVIIHKIVHAVDTAVANPAGLAKQWSPRARTAAPVVAALISIIPVVPLVDMAAESIMEPTLGAYLGLTFDHNHHHEKKHDTTKQD